MFTLFQSLDAYLRLAGDLRSAKKLRYRLNCWGRHAPLALPVTAEAVAGFRASAAESGLSPVTIEGTISDIVTILRGTGGEVPDLGRRMKRPRPTASQPSLDDIGKVYAAADQAAWPKRWLPSQRVRWWRGYLFLSLWSGLRIEDLRTLRWSDVFADRIDRVANKTSARHVFPVTLDVQRHLDVLRGLHSEFVVPVARGSLRFVRDELTELCRLANVNRFGPQMLRRASITEWTCTAPDAGALIHGCGLGVRSYYVNTLKVLSRAAENFRMPREMLDGTTRSANDAALKRLLMIAKRLNSAENINRLARMAEAW